MRFYSQSPREYHKSFVRLSQLEDGNLLNFWCGFVDATEDKSSGPSPSTQWKVSIDATLSKTGWPEYDEYLKLVNNPSNALESDYKIRLEEHTDFLMKNLCLTVVHFPTLVTKYFFAGFQGCSRGRYCHLHSLDEGGKTRLRSDPRATTTFQYGQAIFRFQHNGTIEICASGFAA
jgi:hypothetical protein